MTLLFASGLSEGDPCWSSSLSLSLSQMLQLLRRNVSSSRSKNVDILNVASQIAREMNGIKFTACKNGRDNTAMAVKLQQVISTYRSEHVYCLLE